MEIPQPPPASPSPSADEGPAPLPRQLAVGEGAAWWGESWRIFCAAPGIWVAILLIFVQMQTVPTAIACLVVAGFSQSLAMISIAVILMRTASENFRGRVMGVRMMVIYGLPIGLLAAGSLIDEIGFAATGTLYVAAGLALMLAVMLHWRADLWHVHAPANAR